MTKRHATIAPVHPGEILRDDAFPALKTTKPALASALRVSRQTLHEIMTLKRGISPEMALRLEAVVGSTAETWLAMQCNHDLWQARKRVNLRELKRLSAA
jgi:antitoxin HigA-1